MFSQQLLKEPSSILQYGYATFQSGQFGLSPFDLSRFGLSRFSLETFRSGYEILQKSYMFTF